MIIFEDVHKSYPIRSHRHVVLDRVNVVFNTNLNTGILGLNGAGKSTLLRLISGIELPNRGRVRRLVNVSFPLGFTGCFAGSMSGRENTAFVARVYGFEAKEVIRFVDEFSELGKFFDEPVKTYSTGMRSRLGFGLSLALEFDVYLIDEGTATGDARFLARCQAAFEERMSESRIIMVSHDIHTLRTYCQIGAVLHDGRLIYYDTLDEACERYEEIVRAPSAAAARQVLEPV